MVLNDGVLLYSTYRPCFGHTALLTCCSQSWFYRNSSILSILFSSSFSFLSRVGGLALSKITLHKWCSMGPSHMILYLVHVEQAVSDSNTRHQLRHQSSHNLKSLFIDSEHVLFSIIALCWTQLSHFNSSKVYLSNLSWCENCPILYSNPFDACKTVKDWVDIYVTS